MKQIAAILFCVLMFSQGFSQTTNPNYDADLAEKLGADDYGMKHYVFVVLKTGGNKTDDKHFVDSCFAGHLKNIRRLVDAGKMVVAGPFGKNDKDFRGLFILDIKELEEARALMDTDPAIHAGLLEADLIPWYGSAALREYLDASERIWKKEP